MVVEEKRMYLSYDRGRLMTEEQYVRHLTKKWLREQGITVERLREIAPQIPSVIKEADS